MRKLTEFESYREAKAKYLNIKLELDEIERKIDRALLVVRPKRAGLS